MPISFIISLFMGGVIALQTAANMDNPLLPAYTVGYITRSSTILEFSPTILSLILAGKIGSNIASEIGTMRVTEQIDALETMGINSLTYLILPKIVAAVLFFPIILVFSIGLSLTGGWFSLVMSGFVFILKVAHYLLCFDKRNCFCFCYCYHVFILWLLYKRRSFRCW